MIKLLYPGGRSGDKGGPGGGERRFRQRGLYATYAPDLAVDPHSAPAPGRESTSGDRGSAAGRVSLMTPRD
jgi:hypothetical protein